MQEGFTKGSGITFLRIPDREPKRSPWINAIHRKNWVPAEHERVCSVHFLSGKFQFCLMLSAEKCHKTNFDLGDCYSIIFFCVFYYFLFRHSAIAAKSIAYKFSGLYHFCQTFVFKDKQQTIRMSQIMYRTFSWVTRRKDALNAARRKRQGTCVALSGLK